MTSPYHSQEEPQGITPRRRILGRRVRRTIPASHEVASFDPTHSTLSNYEQTQFSLLQEEIDAPSLRKNRILAWRNKQLDLHKNESRSDAIRQHRKAIAAIGIFALLYGVGSYTQDKAAEWAAQEEQDIAAHVHGLGYPRPAVHVDTGLFGIGMLFIDDPKLTFTNNPTCDHSLKITTTATDRYATEYADNLTITKQYVAVPDEPLESFTEPGDPHCWYGPRSRSTANNSSEELPSAATSTTAIATYLGPLTTSEAIGLHNR